MLVGFVMMGNDGVFVFHHFRNGDSGYVSGFDCEGAACCLY